MGAIPNVCSIGLGVLILGSSLAAGEPAAMPKNSDVSASGIKADGKTDDTAAIQKALDVAAKQGGVVRLAGRQVSGGW